MSADQGRCPPYEPSPMDVHIATVRGGLWGPKCAPIAWTVPLIDPDEWQYATCLRCRRERAQATTCPYCGLGDHTGREHMQFVMSLSLPDGEATDASDHTGSS